MDRRFQVFLSSTFSDLADARRQVMNALLQMDCIPAGMELFPATDDEQWSFITKVIDDSDYYLLIIGGRYGTQTADGISYTEKEFDYAVSGGVPIVAFLHGQPEEISARRSELDTSARAKLAQFREKVGTGRLIKHWENERDLPGLVALSLGQTIKTHPRPGWVRGPSANEFDLLRQLNELRQENTRLAEENNACRVENASRATRNDRLLDDLVPMGTPFEAEGKALYGSSRTTWTATQTWEDIFGALAPSLMKTINDVLVQKTLAELLFAASGAKGSYAELNRQTMETIRIQLVAFGLVQVHEGRATDGTNHLWWSLTRDGYRKMMELRALRR